MTERKTVQVDTGWVNGDTDTGGPVLRIRVDGLGMEELGEGPEVMIGDELTADWFGVNVDEARDLYFGLGVMLGELDEDKFSQG